MRGCRRARTSCASAPAARRNRRCRRSWSSAAASTSIRATPPSLESGDIVMNIADGLFDASHIRGEIGEVVLGRIGGRKSDDDITVFKSLGMAVEDVVAADLVFRRAVGIRSRNGADVMNDQDGIGIGTRTPKETHVDSNRSRRAAAVRHPRRSAAIVVAVSWFRQNMTITRQQRGRRDAAVRGSATPVSRASSR